MNTIKNWQERMGSAYPGTTWTPAEYAMQAEIDELRAALGRKDAVLRTCLDACKCVLDQVKSPPVEVDFAIEAIYEELVCTKN